VLRPSPRLDALERRRDREVHGGLDFHQALARFTAMWAYARALEEADAARSASMEASELDWRHDLEADIRVARAVNGLPPA